MMVKSWTTLKRIIHDTGRSSDLFLSLINEDGRIASANTVMLNSLQLKDPRKEHLNFFDLIHPVHLEDFKQVITNATENSVANTIELYVKNGQYHPMKWEINCLEGEHPGKKEYFCLGYKILDSERQKKCNELIHDNYSLIIDSFSGVVFNDQDGEVVAVNKKTASIFNSTLERIYQVKNVKHLWNSQWNISDENGQKVPFDEAPFIKASTTGQSQKKTLIFSLASGEKKWIVFNSQLLPREKHGGNTYVVSGLTDITKEAKLSQSVHDQNALITALFKQTPVLSWVVDAELNLQFGSTTFFNYFSLNTEDCLGKKITDMVPELFVEALYQKHMQVFETGQRIDVTHQTEMADGSKQISYINIFPIPTTSGKKLIAGQAVSLPDKSKLEKELHTAHERLINISRASTDAIWEWDMQTGQIFRNKALLELIGYQPQNSRGLSWWLRLIHPEDRNRVADNVKDATENHQQSWQDEYRFKCADGTYKQIQDRGFVVYENELPVKMIGSLQDISNVKELEQELASEKLERQRETSETIIRVQEKERTRIGHELHDNVNQILSTTRLFVDMMVPANHEQQQIKKKSIEYLHMALEEIRKLSKELVAPEMKEGTLADGIKILIGDLEMATPIKIDFTFQIEETLLTAGKKITLFRIIQEQLKNILKHSKATKAIVAICTHEEAIELSIQDNGTGFDPGHTRRGIGISNIHERAQFYNGSVKIDAAKGKGCTLVVSLPLFD